METTKTTKDRGNEIAMRVALGCLAVYAVWAGALIFGFDPPFQVQGAFGDAFGPLTGLLSSLTLAAAIVSVMRQTEELQLQRRELEETREVLAQQEAAQDRLAYAQEAANRIAEEQRTLDDQRFRWEQEAETRRHERELLATHAQAMHASASSKMAGAVAVNLTKEVDALLAEIRDARIVNANRRR